MTSRAVVWLLQSRLGVPCSLFLFIVPSNANAFVYHIDTLIISLSRLVPTSCLLCIRSIRVSRPRVFYLAKPIPSDVRVFLAKLHLDWCIRQQWTRIWPGPHDQLPLEPMGIRQFEPINVFSCRGRQRTIYRPFSTNDVEIMGEQRPPNIDWGSNEYQAHWWRRRREDWDAKGSTLGSVTWSSTG